MITIFGKEGCKKCEAAKEKLQLLGVEYEYCDLAASLVLHDGWRDDGTVELMLAYTLLDTLPLIRIGGVTMDYPTAIRTLKNGIC